MTAASYRFKVGSIECVAVSDGTFTYPSQAFAVNEPVERFDHELEERGLPPREVVTPYISMLVNTGKNCVLVDTGAGFAPTNGKLLQNLEAEGVKAAEIDTVILTHGHADHIGGNTDGSGRLAFPNARYVMWASDWEFWTQDEPNLTSMPVDKEIRGLLVEVAHSKLLPLGQHIELIDRETEIVPGLHAIPAPGHTPGHMALSISSGDEQVLHVADTVLHPISMEHPTWYTAFDLLTEQAAETRYRILDRAAVDRALVFAFHFPFPGLGQVAPYDRAWRWEPLGIPQKEPVAPNQAV